MAKLLERALSEVNKLSAAEQDAIAAIILEELADERRWDETFARSPDGLARLAEAARADIREGRVHDLGIDEL